MTYQLTAKRGARTLACRVLDTASAARDVLTGRRPVPLLSLYNAGSASSFNSAFRTKSRITRGSSDTGSGNRRIPAGVN